MAYWLFKQSEQNRYPDVSGSIYVFNNTHSSHVTAGDGFIYLDKREGKYAFNGHGAIQKVVSRVPEISERDGNRITAIYTAHLHDYVPYTVPLNVQYTSVSGRQNRALLGIEDFNKLGWSRSVAKVDSSMYGRIIDHAYEVSIVLDANETFEHQVPDSSSYAKVRDRKARFRHAVMRRQGPICAICGTTLEVVLDAAHISDWATDVDNRANPANGIIMCAFCHRAFDRGVFRLDIDGQITVLVLHESDSVANVHFLGMAAADRARLIAGVDEVLLRKRYIA